MTLHVLCNESVRTRIDQPRLVNLIIPKVLKEAATNTDFTIKVNTFISANNFLIFYQYIY